jgi:hypothetical protein
LKVSQSSATLKNGGLLQVRSIDGGRRGFSQTKVFDVADDADD